MGKGMGVEGEQQRQPWEQQLGEPSSAYVRFCYYRDLGPGRSLLRAYQAALRSVEAAKGGNQRQHVPGVWTHDSAAYRWRDRVAAWDAHCLTTAGREAALIHVDTIRVIATKVNRAARRLRGPKDWQQLMESANALSCTIAPETVEAIAEEARRGNWPRRWCGENTPRPSAEGGREAGFSEGAGI